MIDTNANEPPTVLIVEDNTELAELYAIWLKDSYRIELAHNCDMTYEKIDDSIDIVLLDRNLPGGTGDEILAKIREIGLDCRVAMVTGEDPSLDILGLDFDEYLCKPVSCKELTGTVSRLVTRTNIRDAITEFEMLNSKKALVETHCSPEELAASDQYSSIEERMEELREKLHSHSSIVSTDSGYSQSRSD